MRTALRGVAARFTLHPDSSVNLELASACVSVSSKQCPYGLVEVVANMPTEKLSIA